MSAVFNEIFYKPTESEQDVYTKIETTILGMIKTLHIIKGNRWVVLGYPAMHNKWKFGRNTQQSR